MFFTSSFLLIIYLCLFATFLLFRKKYSFLHMDIHEKSETEKLDEIMLPGFRFHPTDEELVGFYLKKKVQQRPLSIELIRQLDIYKYDPWDLPKLATTGEKEWYFYCPRDRKYRNSARPNRVTGAGFWKATGTDRPIYSSDEPSKCIGLKKSLVFYKGRAAKGTKTDWMMHEFRLPSLTDNGSNSKRFIHKNIPPNDSWAICRIFKKANSNAQKALSHSWVSPVLPEKMSTELSSGNQYGIISNNIDLQQYSSSNITSFSPKYEAQPYCKMFLPPETYEHPKYTTLDASSVLMNMSAASNLGDFGRALECLEYTTSGLQDHQYVQNAGFSVCEGEEHRAYRDELHVVEQWGLNRSPLISSSSTAAAAAAAAAGFPFNLCDSSPCPSDQLSTSLCTDHCYA